MNLEVLDEAKAEVKESFERYLERSPRSAHRFADLVADGLAEIAANPLRYPLYEIKRNPGNVHRLRLIGYPYVIVYQVLADAIFVIAVAHTSRRPGYWRSRIGKK